ncbi:hypothetical protein K2X92_01775 [Candidatus Gracilibacteria bacterium]|nr:hypothetical protein [Candidatus Gracilibacteria bacterium]
MPQGLELHGRNHTSKKPIRSFNTTKTGRGGDQSGRYHANAGWEKIEAAHARAHIDPAKVIAAKIKSLKSRVSDIGRETFNVSPEVTRKKIKAVQLLISRFSGDRTGFLAELKDIEQSQNSSK